MARTATWRSRSAAALLVGLALVAVPVALHAAIPFRGSVAADARDIRAQNGAANTDASAIDAVRSLAAALARGDAEGARALFAPDAGYAYGRDAPLSDPEGFERWLESDVLGPGSVFEIEEARIDPDGRVDALVRWGRGSADRPSRYVFGVDDGRIHSWWMVSRP